MRTHLNYTNWATNRLLAQVAELSPEELRFDFGTATKTVVGTLAHVYWADTLWLCRVQGAPRPEWKPSEVNLARLQQEWPELQERWKALFENQTDETVDNGVHYSGLDGQQFTQPLWQIVLHIVNHAAHHRGQASGFLRALGKTPQPLDLAAYYRQLGPWKS